MCLVLKQWFIWNCYIIIIFSVFIPIDFHSGFNFNDDIIPTIRIHEQNFETRISGPETSG